MGKNRMALAAILLAFVAQPAAPEELADMNVENLFGEWLKHCEYKDKSLGFYAMENLSPEDHQRWVRNEGFDAQWRTETEARLLRERQEHRERYLSLTQPVYRESSVYTLGDYDAQLGGFVSPEGWILVRFKTYAGTPREFAGHIKAGIDIYTLPYTVAKKRIVGSHAPPQIQLSDFFAAKQLWPESMPRTPGGGPSVVLPMPPDLAREIAESPRYKRRIVLKYEARVVGCSPERWPIIQASNMTVHLYKGVNWRGYPKAGRQLARWE